MFSYLVLVKLIHSLCDSITIIHPHHPGKPGDKASIAWRWVDVRVLPWLPSGHNLHSPRCARLNISCCALPSIPKGWLLTLGAKLSSTREQLGWVKVKRIK